MIRIALAAAICCAASVAHAWPCWMVRKAVAQYGEQAVEDYARAKGMTEAELAKHRKCLK